jgi:hypothetical protein
MDGGGDNILKLAALNEAAWWADCVLENGKPLPTVENATVALEIFMPNAFAYDELLRAPMLMQPPNGEGPFTPGPLPTPMSSPCSGACSAWGLSA